MRKLLFALLLALPIGAFADHIDVIEIQLNEGCSVSTYLAIKDDFNEQWGGNTTITLRCSFRYRVIT